MSDEACCEVCKKTGRRKRMTWAPKGWSYAEVAGDDGDLDEDGKPLVLIVVVCSDACKTAFWKPGPGKFDPDEVLGA